MKLYELANSSERGTYVGLRLNKESKDAIKKIQKEFDVPNPNPISKMHSTLIYSRKHLPDFKPRGKLDEPVVAKVKKLEIFPSKEGNNVLVVTLNCPEMKKRHEEIMDEHEATYDYDEFKAHLTLSYDCGDYDTEAHNIKEKLPELTFDEEYDEELNLNWVSSNTKK